MIILSVKFPLLKNRIKDVYIAGIVPSVLATFFLTKVFDGGDYILPVSVFMNIFYLVWSAYCLLGYRVAVPTVKRYFKTNLTVVSSYCFIGVLFAVCLQLLSGTVVFNFFNKLYTYLFFNFKMFHFVGINVGLDLGVTVSALMFTAVNIALVIVIPYIFDKKKYLEYFFRKKKT